MGVQRCVAMDHSQPRLLRSSAEGARWNASSRSDMLFGMNSSSSRSDSNLLGNKNIHIAKEGANLNHFKEEVPTENVWNVDQVKEVDPFFNIERSHEVIDDSTPSQI